MILYHTDCRPFDVSFEKKLPVLDLNRSFYSYIYEPVTCVGYVRGQSGQSAFVSVREKRRKFPCFILENELTSPENDYTMTKGGKKIISG